MRSKYRVIIKGRDSIMKNNSILYTIIAVVMVIILITLVVLLFVLHKQEQSGIVPQIEQQSSNESNTVPNTASVSNVIDNYEKYNLRKIRLEGLVVTPSKGLSSFYIIDSSEAEWLINQPIGQPDFNKNRAVNVRPTNRITDFPTIRYGDRVVVTGDYYTYVTAGVYYSYEIIIEKIEVIDNIF